MEKQNIEKYGGEDTKQKIRIEKRARTRRKGNRREMIEEKVDY